MATRIVQFPAATQPDKKEKKRRKNERADGLRQVRIDLGVDPVTGKRTRQSFYGDTLKEAEKKREAFLREREAEEHRAEQLLALGLDPHRADITVEAWTEEWLRIYAAGRGYSSRVTADQCAGMLTNALGSRKLRNVLQADIQAFARACGAKYSKTQVSKIRNTTRQIFETARANRITLSDPCAGVQWMHQGEGTHRALETWEIKHICTYWREHRAGLWMMIMLFAGLRRGEVLALRWEDIDIEADVLRVRCALHFEVNEPVYGPPKTKASVREVPILPPLREALESLYGPYVSEYVCTGADGQAVTQSIWKTSLDAYLRTMTNALNGEQAFRPGRRSDLDQEPRRVYKFRAHDLRHTFASMLYEAEVDIKTAQKWLGHSSPEITMRVYTHFSTLRGAKSTSKIAEFSAQFTTPILHPNT